MTTTEPGELLKHVLAARDALHPSIPDDFLEAVLRAVEDAGEEADGGMRAIEAAIDATLANNEGAAAPESGAPQPDEPTADDAIATERPR